MTHPHQASRINDVLYEIHRDIAAELSGKRLSRIAAYSEQHFHRVFQAVVGETLHQYVRRTRLEHAANQLMFDPKRPVQEIAEQCGFASLSSFSRAFRHNFGVAPGQWRARAPRRRRPPYLSDGEIAAGYARIQGLELPRPELVERHEQRVAYVRHLGYGRSIRLAWQTLQAWAVGEGRPFAQQFGLHHSNPAWVPLAQCRYVACVTIDKPIVRRGVVNGLTIPGGLHAAFELQGKYGELLPYLSKILEQWLPDSGFKMQTTPAFVHYRKNHFLAPDECFDLTFFLPIAMR